MEITPIMVTNMFPKDDIYMTCASEPRTNGDDMKYNVRSCSNTVPVNKNEREEFPETSKEHASGCENYSEPVSTGKVEDHG